MLNAGNILLFVLALLAIGGIINNFHVVFYSLVLKKEAKTDLLLLWLGLLGALVLTGYPYKQLEKWAWIPVVLDITCSGGILILLGFIMSDLKSYICQKFQQIFSRQNRP